MGYVHGDQIKNFFWGVKPWYIGPKILCISDMPGGSCPAFFWYSALPHGPRMGVNRLHQGTHMVWGGELADAVPQVEDVRRDRKSTRLNSVTLESRMPSSA